MRVLLVHPSALMYSEIFLRLEPLGLERVASAAAGRWSRCPAGRPAGLPRRQSCGASSPSSGPTPSASASTTWPMCRRSWTWPSGSRYYFPVAWSSSAATACRSSPSKSSATRTEPSTSCSRAKGETGAPALLAALPDRALAEVPGAVTADGPGRPPKMLHSLDDHLPARHLGGRRRKYFIGVMDPAASIEFTRGCPWDCSFCSAWTFYGRSYRRLSADAAVEDMTRITRTGRLHRRRRGLHQGRAGRRDRAAARAAAGSARTTTSRPAVTC